MLLAAAAVGVPALVRVPSNDEVQLKKASRETRLLTCANVKP